MGLQSFHVCVMVLLIWSDLDTLSFPQNTLQASTKLLSTNTKPENNIYIILY